MPDQRGPVRFRAVASRRRRAGGREESESGSQPWTPDETWVLGPSPGSPRRSRRRDRPADRTRWQPRLRDLAIGKEGVAPPGGHASRTLAGPRGAGGGRRSGAWRQAGRPHGRCHPGLSTRALPRRPPHPAKAGRAVPGRPRPASCTAWPCTEGQVGQAARQLEAYRVLTGSIEQHPVLADCYGPSAAGTTSKRLDRAAPSLTERRAGRRGPHRGGRMRADHGDLAGAIRMLERAGRRVGRPRSATSVRGTPWLTCTNGPATWPGPESCSNASPQPTPTPST